MDRDALIEIAETEMSRKKDHSHRETGFAFYHGLRTAKIALQLRKQLFPDNAEYDDVIFAAALFHDIGKLQKPHNITGGKIARALLCTYFNEVDLSKIIEIITLHTDHSDNMKNFPDYVKLVMDADIIDHDGTMDVWMNFLYAAVEDMKMEQALNFFETFNVVNQKQRNSKFLNYEFSKEIQKNRFEFEKSFFEQFKKEMNGEV